MQLHKASVATAKAGAVLRGGESLRSRTSLSPDRNFDHALYISSLSRRHSSPTDTPELILAKFFKLPPRFPYPFRKGSKAPLCGKVQYGSERVLCVGLARETKVQFLCHSQQPNSFRSYFRPVKTHHPPHLRLPHSQVPKMVWRLKVNLAGGFPRPRALMWSQHSFPRNQAMPSVELS